MRGDPSLIGWATTVLYGVVTVFALRAARRQRGRRRRFWVLSAIGLAALGVNKQLDLQTDLIRVAKATVTTLGWYPAHRTALMLGVGALALLGVAAAFGLLVWLTKHHFRQTRLAVVGWILLAVFIALRAATFHHLDEFGLGFLRLSAVVLLELGGLVAILVAALRVPGPSEAARAEAQGLPP